MPINEKEPLTPLLRDREVTKQKVRELVNLGRPIVEQSNLVRESTVLTADDVTKTKRLIQTIAPVDKENYRIHEHLQLVAQFARKVGEELKNNKFQANNNLNLSELEILALLHDVGRFFTHRWLRSDLIASHFLNELGVRKDITKNLPDVRVYTSKRPDESRQADAIINNMSLRHRIIEIVDFCGKRKPDGGIRTFEEVLEYHRAQRGKEIGGLVGTGALWGSERKLNSGVIELSTEVYKRLYDQFRESGADLELLREAILLEEANSPIRVVVFDVGNVLIPNPDQETLADIEKAFDIEAHVAETAWAKLIPPMQRGEITEEVFWQQFGQAINKPLPEGHRQVLTRHLAHQINPEVKKIIDLLKKKGYELAIHSDTIPPQAKALEKSGIYSDFQQKILSFNTRVTKDSLDSFRITAIALDLPPQACLFIDDKSKYVKEAQQVGMKGVVAGSPRQLVEDLQSMSVL